MNVEAVARVCHEANAALCQAFGDNTQLHWDEAPAWQRESAIAAALITWLFRKFTDNPFRSRRR